jgi:hypothetical protein
MLSPTASTSPTHLVKRVVLTYTPNNYLEWEKYVHLLLNRTYGIGNILRRGSIPPELVDSYDAPASKGYDMTFTWYIYKLFI